MVGQDEAIEQIVNIYQTYLAGMSSPGRPIGNFLFLGPTGSGKTRMVEATAEAWWENARAVIKIDCAEFQHSHEIAKLIGSPPGYLGHRETHPLLSQEVLNQYHTDKIKLSFVLFDEIEKASDASVEPAAGHPGQGHADAGRQPARGFLASHDLHDQQPGRGGDELHPAAQLGIRGFRNGTADRSEGEADEDTERRSFARRRGSGAAEVHAGVHEPHRQGRGVPAAGRARNCATILTIELNILQQRIFNSANGAPFVFSLRRTAKDFPAARRHRHEVRRAAPEAGHRSLVHPLSNLIATEQVRGGDLIGIDFDAEKNDLVFVKEAEKMPASAMAQMVNMPPASLRAAAAARASELKKARAADAN